MEVFTWFADWLVYGLLGLAPATPLSGALQFFVEDVGKIFFLLIVVVFVIGFFRSMLAPERVRKMLGGRNRWFSFPAAVGLGAVTPFCSCSSVPLFIGFLEAGIPLGVTMAFLITSPMINEIAVFLLISTLGLEFTLIYVVTGLVVGLVGGLVIDRLRLEHWVEDYVWKIRMGETVLPEGPHGLRDRLSYALEQVREIVGRLWLYILIGVGVGAGLHGFVPAEQLMRYAGPDNPFAVPMSVLIGIPLYSNATGMIPVVEALLAKGLPVGTVLALMMSVVALSLPEIMMLKKVLKWPLLVVFIAVLAVSITIVGYLFNALF
ncbi:MAG: permease [Magnetospirillum sp.]|nr:permease [Magnetospirillum sp.]